MSDSENSDTSVSWEDFFGPSTELMPTLLGLYDELLETKQQQQQQQQADGGGGGGGGGLVVVVPRASSGRRTPSPSGVGVINLSPNVHRMLAHLQPGARNSFQFAKCESTPSLEPVGGDARRPMLRNGTSEVNVVVAAAAEQEPLKPAAQRWQRVAKPAAPPPQVLVSAADDMEVLDTRPLSMSSIASSSSSNSSVSSSIANKNTANAYLASIESLDDDSECEGRKSGKQTVLDSDNNRTPGGAPEAGLAASARPRYCDPQLSAVERVLLEIVDTEAVYVADLQEVIQGYLKCWEEDEECPFFVNIPDLFSNINEIFKFNSEFLDQLRQCGSDPVSISQTFVRNNCGFEIYTQYCTNYPKTMSVLTALMSNDLTAKIFRDQQSRLGHSLPLGSYLLKPVQRILKYHLLLQNLVKQCEAKDVSDIELALSTMTGIAKHINNMKRKHEHAVRVQEIQSLLYGWMGEDLTTFGELCAEGTFRMHGAKAHRHAFLFDKMLLLTKNKEDGILSYKTHIMCSNLMLIESVQGEPLSFHVIPFDNPRMQYTLQARNSEQKREWTLQLKRVILENYNAVIPSHARQLVMELGQNKVDDEVLADKSSFCKRQYSAPEYLQRRKMDRERRKSETGLRSRLRRHRKEESSPEVDMDSSLLDETAKSDGSPSSTPRRNKVRNDSLTRDRSKSRDTFVKFGSWRRKSEPGDVNYTPSPNHKDTNADAKLEEQLTSPDSTLDFRIPQYNTKTLPKKIYKLKKARNKHKGSKFYTDLSDASHCDEVLHISESNDSLSTINDLNLHVSEIDSTPATPVELVPEQKASVETVEDIVSQLLMQNREFQKILKKQKKQIGLRNRVNKTTLQKAKLEKLNDTSDSEMETPEKRDDPLLYETLKNNAENGQLIPQTEKNTNVKIKTNNLTESRTLKYPMKNQQSPPKQDESDYVVLTYNGGHLNNYRNKLNNVRSGQDNIDRKHQNVRLDTQKVPPKLNLKEDPSLVKKSPEHAKDRDMEINYENLNSIWHKLNSIKDMTTWYSPEIEPTSNPNTPEVWLKQQNEHLVTTHTKKAGSLPRSFEMLNNQSLTNEIKYLTREGKIMHGDRPLTIANDSSNELDFNDIENFILGNNDHTNFPRLFTNNPTEQSKDGCNVDVPDVASEHSVSCQDLPQSSEPIYAIPNHEPSIRSNPVLNTLNIHPEYKIYRPTINLSSFRNVLVKAGKGKQTENNDDSQKKLPSTIMQKCSRSLLQRFKSIINEENLPEDTDIVTDTNTTSTKSELTVVEPPKTPFDRSDSRCIEMDKLSGHINAATRILPTYKQGSRSLGARIAQSDYANPNDLFLEGLPENTLINKNSLRPDSLLSINSQFTSSSDGCQCDQANPPDIGCTCEKKSLTPNDCFYEKSFEETEQFLEADLFRDSAVYSDPDEKQTAGEVSVKTLSHSVQTTSVATEPKWHVKTEINVVTIKNRFSKAVTIPGRIETAADSKIVLKSSPSSVRAMEAKNCLTVTTQRKLVKRPSKLPPPIPIKPDFGKIPSPVKTEFDNMRNVDVSNICDTHPTTIVEKVACLKKNSFSEKDCEVRFEMNKSLALRRKDLSTQAETKPVNKEDSSKQPKSNISTVLNKKRDLRIPSKVQICPKNTISKFSGLKVEINKTKESKIPIGKITASGSNRNVIGGNLRTVKLPAHKLGNSCNNQTPGGRDFVDNSLGNDVPISSSTVQASKGWVKHVVDKFQ